MTTTIAGRIRLNDGEQVIKDEIPSAFRTAGVYVFTLGLWAIWRSRHHFVVTNQRVIVMKGIVTKQVQSVQLDRIQDVQVVESLLAGGYVRLSSAGGSLGVEALGPLTRARARELADDLSQLLRSHQGDGLGGRSTPSVAAELERLGDLRAKGILTNEEFNAQKAKLLDS